LSIDPIITDLNTGLSFNRYVYADNSPYKYTDPDGRGPVGWVLKLLENGGQRTGRALGSHAEAVAARKSGENVLMETRSRAKAVETAANGGDAGKMMKHTGHDLPDGGVGMPHYQTDKKYGHTFWGNLSAAVVSVDVAVKSFGEGLWEDFKSDPVGSIFWILGTGNSSNDSDKVGNDNPGSTPNKDRPLPISPCGISCGNKEPNEYRPMQ
jgi:hypothetical protein